MMTTFDTSTLPPSMSSTSSTATPTLNDFQTELMMTNGNGNSNSSSNGRNNNSNNNNGQQMSSSNSVVSSNSPSNLSNDDSNSVSNSITSSLNNLNQYQQQSQPPSQHQQHQQQPTIDQQHLARIFQECRNRLTVKQKNLEQLSNRLQNQYSKAQQDIGQSFQVALNALEKGKNDLTKELEDIYNARIISLTIFTSKIEENLRKIEHMLYYMEQGSTTNNDCTNELINCKSFLDNKLQAILNIDLDSSYHTNELEFITNYSAIHSIVKNNIGYIRSENKFRSNYHQNHQGGNGGGGNGSSTTATNNQQTAQTTNGYDSPVGSNGGGGQTLVDRFGTFNLNNNCSNNNNRSLSTSISDSLNTFTYDKWSSVGSMNGNCIGTGNGNGSGSNSSPDTTLFTAWNNAMPNHQDGVGGCGGLQDLSNNDPTMSDLINNEAVLAAAAAATMSTTSTIMPIKSQVQRQKMIYHCKFGEFGIMEGQFTEPSGVAVNAQNDIIVADTNNHRIQIFDKDGRFKFQFGECGKRDGQLLYPNRVAVVKQSGDIIVTERSPTHQIQVYNQYGQFVRKFGADILQHPRGVTVDNKGNIIIVECKVMRVIIFDLMGNVLHKFGCSKHLEFPNGVVVNDKQEIFISDNRAHCVKVFSYSGTFLRNIGGEGLTNYPIGVCINDNGEILVADNHNNFNITIFTQDGQLVNALESKVKHSQCFDVALMDDNSVVLASKDYRIYIYRYLQLQSLATAVATSGIC